MTTILALWLLTQGPNKPSCQISGTVELRRDKKRVDARNAAVVFVRHVPKEAWTRSEEKGSVITQSDRQFDPQLKVVLKGEEITFLNQDLIRHNVFSRTRGQSFNLGTSNKDATGKRKFDLEGGVHLQCNIHKKMKADLLVVENPFAVIVGADDSFELPPLPAGVDYEIVAWEKNGGQTPQVLKECNGKQRLVFRVNGKEEPEERRYDDTIYPPDTTYD